jgi:hypothetical protein
MVLLSSTQPTAFMNMKAFSFTLKTQAKASLEKNKTPERSRRFSNKETSCLLKDSFIKVGKVVRKGRFETISIFRMSHKSAL